MSRIPLLLALLAGGVCLPRPADGDEAVTLLRIPNEGIQPQVVVDKEQRVHLVYFRGDPAAGDLFYVRQAADSWKFSEPLPINSQPGSAIAVGSIRGGQIALGTADRIHVAWNGSSQAQPRGPGKYDSPMLYARLNDERSAFEQERDVIGQAHTLDGGGSVAADREGNVHVVWHAGTDEAERRVWVVRSRDEGRTFSEETPVDVPRLGACGCCGLKAFADAGGAVYVLYRSAHDKVHRDMQLLTSRDQGMTFRQQPLDQWMVATCPMSSESFAEGAQGVFAAWETNGQVSFARIDKKSGKAGRVTPAPGKGTGRKHPVIAVSDKGHLLLAWTEGTGWQKGGALAWQEFDAAGKPTRVRGRQAGIPVWSFAAVAARPDGGFAIVY
ncbi:MAG: sialidase family protein [Planctomycetales bacterium]